MSILAGNDAKCVDYLTKWLADIIQNPGSKECAIAPIFLSKQGAGKNIFFKLFAILLGKDFYLETANPGEDLFGTHAEGFYNRILIDIDESNFKANSAIHERLKNAVTSDRLNVNIKFSRPVETRNFVRLFFTTNNIVSMKISNDDRRHVIFEVSNEMCGNRAYFRNFISYMNQVENQKAVIEYLRSIDLKNVNWIEDRPITDAYMQSKQCTQCTILQYLEYLVFDVGIEEGYNRSGSGLFEDYKDWCARMNIREIRHANVVNQIFASYGTEVDNSITKSLIKGKTKYKFYPDGIKTVLEKHGVIMV